MDIGVKRHMFRCGAGVASVGVIIWAALALTNTSDEFHVDTVMRIAAGSVQENELITLTAKSGKSFWVVPSVEVWNGKDWRAVSNEYTEVSGNLLDPSGLISVPVPPKGTRWRVKVTSVEVDAERLRSTECFIPIRSVSFGRRLLERVGLLHAGSPERVQYLASENF